MYNVKLLLNQPIAFHDICVIYPPTIKNILDYSIEEYSKLFVPFTASLDTFDIPEDELIKYKNFDLFFIHTNQDDFLMKAFNQPYLKLLQNAILYFCKAETNVNLFDKKIYFDIEKTKYIDRDNFDEFADLIFCLSTKEKPKKEILPDFKSEKQKELYYKTMAGRQRSASKYVVNLESMINDIMFGGKNYISHEEILKMNIWMLNNAHRTILSLDGYDANFKQYLAGADPKQLDLTHWTQKIKI